VGHSDGRVSHLLRRLRRHLPSREGRSFTIFVPDTATRSFRDLPVFQTLALRSSPLGRPRHKAGAQLGFLLTHEAGMLEVMLQQLQCARCKAILSKTVEVVPVRKGYRFNPRPAAGESLVPASRCYEMGDIPVIHVALGGHFTESCDLPLFVLNPEDIYPKVVSYTSHKERLDGCCGIAGLSGLNRICQCGAEVGTESSDCYLVQGFFANPKTTRWISG